VTAEHLEAYRAYLLGPAGLRPSRVNRRLSALRVFLRWAAASGLARPDLAAEVERVPQARPPPRQLAEADRARLLRAVAASGNARDLAVVLLLARTGLRVGEVASLRLEDLTLGARSGGVRVGRDRRVQLDPETRRALARYLAVRPTSTSEALFLSQLDRGLTANGVHGLVVGHSRRAALPRATPRVLRPG
jgi:integrase/recombinase XerC